MLDHNVHQSVVGFGACHEDAPTNYISILNRKRRVQQKHLRQREGRTTVSTPSIFFLQVRAAENSGTDPKGQAVVGRSRAYSSSRRTSHYQPELINPNQTSVDCFFYTVENPNPSKSSKLLIGASSQSDRGRSLTCCPQCVVSLMLGAVVQLHCFVCCLTR